MHEAQRMRGRGTKAARRGGGTQRQRWRRRPCKNTHLCDMHQKEQQCSLLRLCYYCLPDMILIFLMQALFVSLGAFEIYSA